MPTPAADLPCAPAPPPQAAVNTTLSAAFAALTCLGLAILLGLPGDIGPLLNGAQGLAGQGLAAPRCSWAGARQASAHEPSRSPLAPATPPPLFTCAGVLAGAVSITAGCALVQSYAAAVIGVVGGLVYTGASRLLQR